MAAWNWAIATKDYDKVQRRALLCSPVHMESQSWPCHSWSIQYTSGYRLKMKWQVIVLILVKYLLLRFTCTTHQDVMTWTEHAISLAHNLCNPFLPCIFTLPNLQTLFPIFQPNELTYFCFLCSRQMNLQTTAKLEALKQIAHCTNVTVLPGFFLDK